MDPLLKKIAIGCFCIFHMFSVALYAAPEVLQDESSVVQFLNYYFKDTVKVYAFTTSQWQTWPLFAPDPLRKVTRMNIEKKQGNAWVLVQGTDDLRISWWRHSKEIKTIDRLNREGREEIQKRYLELQCEKYDIPPGTEVRIRFSYYVIPKNTIQRSTDWWHNWNPQWNHSKNISSTCPHVQT